MDEHTASAIAERLRTLDFDEGLSVTQAEVLGLPAWPVLVVRFVDARYPFGEQAAWWDFGACEEFLDDLDGVASFAKVFLEELFWAGGPYEERPRDATGTTWGEMDSETRQNRLPPFLRA